MPDFLLPFRLLPLAFQNLRHRRTRGRLTVIGIAIGVMAVVVLQGFAAGLVEGYAAMGSGADLVVYQDGAVDLAFSALSAELEDDLAAMPGVKAVAPMVYTFIGTEQIPYLALYGYRPGSFALARFHLVEGGPLPAEAPTGADAPLLVGKGAAEALDATVGETLILQGRKYRVVGIYETGHPFEDTGVITTLEEAQEQTGKPGEVSAFYLEVVPGTDAEAVGRTIEQRLNGVTAATSAHFTQQQMSLDMLRQVADGIALIALLIGGVGMMNTMMMSVLERTREIGVLRALGWRRRRVVALILDEAWVLGLLGGLIGAGAGLLLLLAMRHRPAVRAFMPAQLPLEPVAQGLILALVLGFLGGLLPALRAAFLLPIEAIRAVSGTVHVPRHIPLPLLRHLLRRPFRTALTIVGVGIAVASILSLTAMGEGLADAFGGLGSGRGASLIALQRGASVDLSQLDEAVVGAIAAVPGVAQAEGFLTGYAQLPDYNLPFFIATGYPPDGPTVRSLHLVAGERLTSDDEVMLGEDIADTLGLKVGDRFHLFGHAYRICGIFRDSGSSFLNGAAIFTLKEAQQLFRQPDRVSFINIWLDDPKQADAVIARIEAEQPDVLVSRTDALMETVNDFKLTQAMMWGLSLLALVIGGLGMTNTMMMSVFERTREIGVLRALGWRKRRVARMLIEEGVMLSLLGGLLGVALAFLAAWAVRHSVLGSWMSLHFTTEGYLQAAMLTLGLGIIGSLYPAWWAASLLPAEALRYE